MSVAIPFIVFLLAPGMDDRVLQVEVGFLGGAVVLSLLLWSQYRRG